MKTFRRKVRLSFVAMFCGWIACNLMLFIIALGYECFEKPPSPVPFSSLAWVMAKATGLVIAGAWLFVFLPTDLIVADESPLRNWKPALWHGCGWGTLPALPYLLVVGANNPDMARLSSLLLLSLLAGTTGGVAALVRILLDHKSIPKP